MCDQQSLRSACAYAQSDQSLCLLLKYPTNVKLPTEHHLRFQSLKLGCAGSSESTLVEMPHCWKSFVTAQLLWSKANSMFKNSPVNDLLMYLKLKIDDLTLYKMLFVLHIYVIPNCLPELKHKLKI